MRFLIAGYSKVSFKLIQRIYDLKNEIIFIAPHIDYEELKDFDIFIKESDICNYNEISSIVNANSINYFIAVSDEDEVNIISSIIATKAGIDNVILKLNKGFYNNTLPICFPDFKRSGDDFLISRQALKVEMSRLIMSEDIFRVVPILNRKIEIIGVEHRNKFLDNMSILDVSVVINDLSFRVLFMERNNKVIIPTGNDILTLGDKIYILSPVGESDKLSRLLAGSDKYFKKDFTPLNDEEIEKFEKAYKRRVVFYSENDLVNSIAAELSENKSYGVTVLTSNVEKLKVLGEQSDNFSIVELGKKDQDFQVIEQYLANCDIFVAASDKDENNFTACLIAHQIGVKKIIPYVVDVDFINIYKRSGMNSYVSETESVTESIINHIHKGYMINLSNLQSKISVHEFEIRKKSKICSKLLKEIEFPKDIVFAIIKRGENFIVPKGSTRIEEGDIVTIISLKENIENVSKYFSEHRFLGIF